MDRISLSHLPQKFGSFSSGCNRDEKSGREVDRKFSLGHIKFQHDLENSEKGKGDSYNYTIDEGDEHAYDEDETTEHAVNGEGQTTTAEEEECTFASVSEDIENFIGVLVTKTEEDGNQEESFGKPPELPESKVEKFIEFVDEEIAKYESTEEKWCSESDDIAFLTSIDRISKLMTAVTNFSSVPAYNQAMNRSSCVLHRAMSFLEEEFYNLLDTPKTKPQEPGSATSKTKRLPSFNRIQEVQDANSALSTPRHPSESVDKLHRIANSLITAGYVTECCQVFTVARRNSFEASLTGLGYEKHSIDDIVKMAWESLESEIAAWVKTFKHTITVTFTSERELCIGIFADHPAIAHALFHNFARGVIIQLLTFAEAVAMTKRSPEKLFKVLDLYETLRDIMPTIETLFPDEQMEDNQSAVDDLKTEVSSIQSRLGEAVAAMFCDLKNSIKTDDSKTAVPGGAVHPLTRYVMNYLKYACEYTNTIEQVFKQHTNNNKHSACNGEGEAQQNGNDTNNPFAAQLLEVMDLLHSTMESKSKLYKDPSLSDIFMMNNGRYIMQKIKGSAEISQVLGNTWSRKRSSELRQYHKNYQRETWSRLLACLRDDGLQVKGHVSKPMLKERFKNFNLMFEEIHKTQSAWVVSDEQLQSELRVSISAVVVPAYRSFVGRFSQYLDPGRQSEKYIKFGPEDLETFIDELFDGNPATIISRRR